MDNNKILVIGAGGREHTIAWSLSQSKSVSKVFVSPGSHGMNNHLIKSIGKMSNEELIQFVKEKKITLTVVGPEGPLVDGIVDQFNNEGLRIFGPDRFCSNLEGSKIFARNFMSTNNIPHPKYIECTSKQQVLKAVKDFGYPIVLKADGLAAGKGVIISKNLTELGIALSYIFNDKKSDSAFKTICVEEYLSGDEVSIFAVSDGCSYKILGSAQDHKNIYDGDKGPNTGGMGAYSPCPLVSDDLMENIKNTIIEPTFNSLIKKGHPYLGFLYFGLMIVKGKPFVIEYNVRFGDPEAQTVLPLLKTSIFDICMSSVNRELENIKISFNNKFSVCLVLATKGYPGYCDKGFEIKGLNNQLSKNQLIFHAGTMIKDGKWLTNGGRVLSVVCISEQLSDAINKAYDLADKIQYKNKYNRRDIGNKGLCYQ